MKRTDIAIWSNCYDDTWNGWIVPEAFAHPAKFARGLVARIVRYGLEQGFWRKGETILDPFGGIGAGGIVCASHGLQWCGVELEPRFVALAEKNFALHKRTWETMGDPLPEIVQGDSRRLAEVLGVADGCVASPPFQESLNSGESAAEMKERWGKTALGGDWGQDYGTTPGQLGQLPPGDLSAVLSSPPYAESNVTGESRFLSAKDPGGQLASGIVSSPPYSELRMDGQGEKHDKVIDAMKEGYGATEGQLGAMPPGEPPAGVVSYSLPNTHPGGKMIAKGGDHGKETTRVESKTARAGDETVGESAERNRVHVLPGEDVAKSDGGTLRDQSAGVRHGSDSPGHQAKSKGRKRKRALPLQERSAQPGLPQSGCEEPMQQVPIYGQPGDSPQERRSLRQPAGESGSPLQQLPHAGDETQVVGSETSRVANSQEQRPGGVEALISSPPYEGNEQHGRPTKRDAEFFAGRTVGEHGCASYGSSDGQLGQETGETFWTAARQILTQCHAVLRPGAVAAWVVKAFVRKGKIVDFPGDWARLCQACGLTPFLRCRAMLVKEEVHECLFDGQTTTRRERKSFFRRLAEKKGSPRIDWEEVVWTRRE